MRPNAELPFLKAGGRAGNERIYRFEPTGQYDPPLSPRKVLLERGTMFDFDRFAYLVPHSEEARLKEQIEQAGLSFLQKAVNTSPDTLPWGRG